MKGSRTQYFLPELAMEDVTRPIGLLLAVGSIALLVMPVFTTFGELLTNLAMLSGVDAALGIFGIAILNVLRITVVGIVALHFGQLPAVIVHDYGSVIATVVFLMAFWTIAYNSILEPRTALADR